MTSRPHTQATPESGLDTSASTVNASRPLTGDNAPALEAGRSEHTPGPWTFVPWHIAEAPSQVLAPEGWLICETSSDANARLISAAPELLEALDGLVAWIDGDYADDTPEARRIMAAKLAIAKAIRS